MNLKDTLFDCLPAGRYALAGMLRLLDVVETHAVATAAVECHAQPRLLINPAFVAKHAGTPQKLMMLVMHEIHHVLLGHTRRLPSQTAADNFVFDCVINSLLCRMFPQPEYTALFRDFYPEDEFPACLLRPPEGWHPVHAKNLLPAALKRRRKGMAAAKEVYRALYSSHGASYEEVRCLLPVLEGAAGKKPGAGEGAISGADEGTGAGLDGVTLLGDHEHSTGGSASAGDTAFAAAVGDLVKHWPAPPDPLRGQSLEGFLRTSRVVMQRTSGNRQCLRELIRRLADRGTSGTAARRPRAASVPVDTPVPVMSRKAIVARALGVVPLLYQSALSRERPVPAGERVHLYLDVSGSMDELKGAVYGAVLDCERWLARSIHLFSTEIADASAAQLRQGFCRSTGGTDIRCVVRHMRKHRVKRALLLTDGFVGRPSKADAAFLRGVHLGVAYTAGHSNLDLGPFTDHAIELRVQRPGSGQ